MATKKPLFLSKFLSMQDLENNNWILLEFTWNNFDTFRELIQKVLYTICQSSYQTILKLSERYSHTRHISHNIF